MYPKRLWSLPDRKNELFLTFDDGPIPEVTPWVLDCLKAYNAKATFFCIGENVQNHPDLFKRILDEGHSVGNHTFDHLKGWYTNPETYIENVIKAEAEMKPFLGNSFLQKDYFLFRPPYGKLTSRQAKILQNEGYMIVMWDVLSFDWDLSVSEEQCFKNVLENVQDGSIVVFHDSLKAERNLRYCLPRLLHFISNKKWYCEAL